MKIKDIDIVKVPYGVGDLIRVVLEDEKNKRTFLADIKPLEVFEVEKPK